jgi:hypothetical protein
LMQVEQLLATQRSRHADVVEAGEQAFIGM